MLQTNAETSDQYKHRQNGAGAVFQIHRFLLNPIYRECILDLKMACFWNTHRYTYILYQLKYLNTAKKSIAYILFKSLKYFLYVIFFSFKSYVRHEKILFETVETREFYVYMTICMRQIYIALYFRKTIQKKRTKSVNFYIPNFCNYLLR